MAYRWPEYISHGNKPQLESEGGARTCVFVVELAETTAIEVLYELVQSGFLQMNSSDPLRVFASLTSYSPCHSLHVVPGQVCQVLCDSSPFYGTQYGQEVRLEHWLYCIPGIISFCEVLSHIQ